MNTRPRRTAATGLLLLAALGATAACGTAPNDPREPTKAAAQPSQLAPTTTLPTTTLPTTTLPTTTLPTTMLPTTTDASAAPAATSAPASTPRADLAAAFTAELPDLAKRSGVAISGLGSGNAALLLGEVGEDVAWSTIKVPIVVAVRRQDGWSAASERARRAITASDNDAARSLWASLGEGTAPARAVEAVLSDAGDKATTVSAKVSRPPFTAFGQTVWSIDNQARFLSGLACRPEAEETLALMRKVVPAQRWGLGRWHSAALKGGWGPLESGGYLVRQMGVVATPSGKASVALIVRAPGGFDAGADDATRIATWLQKHSGELPAGQCPAAAK